MTSIREAIRRIFSPIQPLPAGMFHYQSPASEQPPYRLHLRLEADGSGVLVVNAATVLHLNTSAAEYAYQLVRGASADEAARAVATRYRASYTQAYDDYRRFVEQLQTLIRMPDLDPQSFLDFERAAPHTQLSAPLRLDCAITYRLPGGVEAQAAPVERAASELSTAEWFAVLDQAWQAGIPHVVFTGGEPTLRDDLPELIAHAEQNGQVSGLLCDGLRLQDKAYLDTLLQTGLDHLLMLCQPENNGWWEALENALMADLSVAVHLTLSEANEATAQAVLEQLARAGVRAVSLSAASDRLGEALAALRERAASLGLELVWDLPVPYSSANPVALETGEDQPPEGAGRAWLYVEPDGDVLPGQGVRRPLGNWLRDGWEKVWGEARGG